MHATGPRAASAPGGEKDEDCVKAGSPAFPVAANNVRATAVRGVLQDNAANTLSEMLKSFGTDCERLQIQIAAAATEGIIDAYN
jgi:hypothetical protein